MDDFQEIILLLKLASFLANQIVFIKLTKATVMTVLHCGDQAFSQMFQMSSIVLNCRMTFKDITNQDHNFTTKGQVKNSKDCALKEVDLLFLLAYHQLKLYLALISKQSLILKGEYLESKLSLATWNLQCCEQHIVGSA